MLQSRFDLDHPDIVSVIDDTPLWSAPFGLALFQAVRLRKHLRALDVGSGLGFPLVELAERLGPTCQVHGIDPWLAANARARQKIAIRGVPHVQVIAGKAERLPFPDRSFDLVVSNNGTNNVDDEEMAFREIARVARPGAQIVLTMNLPDTMKEFYDVYRAVLRAAGKPDEIEKLARHIHEKRKPLSHTRALLQNVGLHIRQIHDESLHLRYSDGSAMLRSWFIQLAFLESWRNVLDPEDRDSVFRDVELELNRVAAHLGELRLTVPWVCLDLHKPEQQTCTDFKTNVTREETSSRKTHPDA